MPTSEICAAGPLVQSLSKDDAFLFLWAPHALVLDGTATKVARAWGFEPKQEIVWIKTTLDGKKPRIGGGHYTRLCTEPLLLCRRGRAKVVRKDVPNVIFAPRGAHSAKPDESYQLIEKLTGATRFLELYARRQFSPKWTAWGDQMPGVAA
jgi:N6-adenosine-specific RNA methylase IME4